MRREGIEAIDLLKMDAEGSEVDIFRGIESDDWSRIKQLAMEVHDADNLLPQVLETLASNGMKPSVDEGTQDRAADIILTATHR